MSTRKPASSGDLYRFVFDTSPVALWLEDFSRVERFLSELRDSGTVDLRAALRADPEMLSQAVGLIEIIAVNEAAVRLVGATAAADVVGPIPSEILNSSDAEPLIAEICAVWDRADRIDVDLEGTKFDGESFDASLVWSVPTVDGELDFSRVVVALSDISIRKEEERQLIALYEELEKSNRELATTVEELGRTQSQLVQAHRLESIGELAAGIAHEINTPIQFVGDNVRFLRDAVGDLTTVQAVVDDLREAAAAAGLDEMVAAFDAAQDKIDLEFLRAEVPAAAEQTLDGIARVAEIVRSLKDFARAGRDELESVDLTTSIKSTLTISRNEWKYVADVETDFDPTLTDVPALPGPLNQAILNVVVNAAHAIAAKTGDRPGETAKGLITIQTREIDGWAEIRVGDTGGGIPIDVRSRIFDPFFTTKDVGRGSGQGLAIAHNVIHEGHGGTLSFKTETGVGTTFIVRIPRRLRAAA